MKKKVKSDPVGDLFKRSYSWSTQSTPMPTFNLLWKTSIPTSPRAQRAPDKPPLHPWPGTKNLPHLKCKKYFHSGKDVLSNFYKTNLRVWNRIFKSTEHGYQWHKAMYLGLDKIAWRIYYSPHSKGCKVHS